MKKSYMTEQQADSWINFIIPRKKMPLSVNVSAGENAYILFY